MDQCTESAARSPGVSGELGCKRLEQARVLVRAQALIDTGHSVRDAAKKVNVPRTTLQGWLAAKTPAESAADVFFNSPEGVEWLQRLVIAAHFMITLVAGGGVRRVCEFLTLSGLERFVASSYGIHQALNVALEEETARYAAQQQQRLSQGMAERTVAIGVDETFHPAICLVGMEPVSGYILAERYAEDRSAASWSAALEEALAGLPLKVAVGVSDEAKGLKRAQKDLGAHHSPDLFHVQHEVVKATSLTLSRQADAAAEAQAQAQAKLAEEVAAQTAYEAEPWPGRPPDFDSRIQRAETQVTDAEIECEAAQARRKEAGELIRGIGEVHHPYDLDSGKAQTPLRAEVRFEAIWARLAELAQAANPPQRARERIDKAQRVTTQLIATLAFFFATVQARVEALNLPLEIERCLFDELIPAAYLDRAAQRAGRAEQRHRIEQTRDQLRAGLQHAEHPLQRLGAQEREELERTAYECADLFQRSSSCVEGRNGQLSLHHHGRHRLSNRKLRALSAVHNFHILRADGTTAAQRLFGQAPEPMFDALLKRLPMPSRPAQKRPRNPRASLLDAPQMRAA